MINLKRPSDKGNNKDTPSAKNARTDSPAVDSRSQSPKPRSRSRSRSQSPRSRSRSPRRSRSRSRSVSRSREEEPQAITVPAVPVPEADVAAAVEPNNLSRSVTPLTSEENRENNKQPSRSAITCTFHVFMSWGQARTCNG
jgi:hypothetical protein